MPHCSSARPDSRGGVIDEAQYVETIDAHRDAAEQALRRTVTALGLDGADGVESVVVEGDPGRALCDLATERGATVIVAGTRGRGGLKRAVLGSVSDHLVRNAPCPVLVSQRRTAERQPSATLTRSS